MKMTKPYSLRLGSQASGTLLFALPVVDQDKDFQ